MLIYCHYIQKVDATELNQDTQEKGIYWLIFVEQSIKKEDSYVYWMLFVIDLDKRLSDPIA